MELTVKRAYKMRLAPTDRQRALLNQHEGASRWGYNWALRLYNKVNKYFKFKTEFFDMKKVEEGLDWSSLSNKEKSAFFERHNEAAKAYGKEKNEAFQNRLLHLLVNVAGWEEKKAKEVIGYGYAAGPSAYSMAAYWAQTRDKDMPWWDEVSLNTWAVKSAFADAHAARQRFLKGGGLVGVPQFKRKGKPVGIRFYGSIYLSERHSRRLVIPNIAPRLSVNKEKALGYYEGVRIEDGKTARRLRSSVKNGGVIKFVTLSRNADYWYASVLVEETIHVPDKDTPTQIKNGDVGVDLGVKVLATLSDGTFVENTRERRKTDAQVSRIQRAMSKNQAPKGVPQSHRYVKLRTRKSRIEHVTSLRRKTRLNQLTSSLAKKYRNVYIEDLNVSGITARPTVKVNPNNPHIFLPNGRAAKSGLAKSVLDVGFYEFKRQIAYKTTWYKSGKVVIIPRFAPSSQTCSACGAVRTGKNRLKLQDRTFTCLACNHTEDRDLNAAKNIMHIGMNAEHKKV